MIFLYILTLTCLLLVGQTNSKCGHKSEWGIDTTARYNITINDPNFGSMQRYFEVTIPATYKQSEKTPLFFYMHSQGQTDIENFHYRHQGKLNNVITVYPLAVQNDWFWDGTNWPGWNVPMPNNNTEACTPWTNIYCYFSCQALGECGQCAWSTCYDDVFFMRKLIEKVKDELCIDDEHVYIAGCSNGGIFSYYLSQQMPEVFKGYILESAQPMIGQMYSPPALKGAHLLTLHGR